MADLVPPVADYYPRWGRLALLAPQIGYVAGYFGSPGSHNAENGTDADPLLGKLVKHACRRFAEKTGARVTPAHVVFRCNPRTALRLSMSHEIRCYIARTQVSAWHANGTCPDSFGLPVVLYGARVSVDRSMTMAGEWADFNWPDGKVALTVDTFGLPPLEPSDHLCSLVVDNVLDRKSVV